MPKDRLEKLRSKAFTKLLNELDWNPLDPITGYKPKKGLKGYRQYLKDVDQLTRRAISESHLNLEDAKTESSIIGLAQLIDAPVEVFMRRLVDRDIKGFDDLSQYVLKEGSEIYRKKHGKSPLDAARPTARRTYEAILMDMWPDSTAAIADFWLTDQKHYEALYYPIRRSEITPEDLDQVLGDSEAITELVNSMPSNPHKDIKYGFGGGGPGDGDFGDVLGPLRN